MPEAAWQAAVQGEPAVDHVEEAPSWMTAARLYGRSIGRAGGPGEWVLAREEAEEQGRGPKRRRTELARPFGASRTRSAQ